MLWRNGGPSREMSIKQQGYVLYFRFTGDSKLRLAGDILEPTKLRADNNARRRAELPDFTKEIAFRNYFRLIGHQWQKSNNKDRRFIPDSYLLREDGAFIASYRDGSCSQHGRWSLTEHLILEAETTICDLRGNRGAVIWNQKYNLEDDLLILDGEYRYHRGK